MKQFLLAVIITTATLPAFAADIGLSVSIGQPGFYGRIDVGNMPQPQLVVATPMIIQPAPVGVVYQPIYLHVPPGHQKNWRKHCREYDACGRPVYFVRGDWYNNEYAPRYRERQRGDEYDKGKDKNKDKNKNKEKNKHKDKD